MFEEVRKELFWDCQGFYFVVAGLLGTGVCVCVCVGACCTDRVVSALGFVW
jgi:hypothetical protein